MTGGANSAAATYSRCVFGSSVIVRERFGVARVCTTVSSSFPSGRATVSVPSPFDAKARPVPGSKAAPSAPAPIGALASTLPVTASTITSRPLPQAAKSRRPSGSKARPVGSSPGARGQVATAACVAVSIATIWLVSSTLTYTRPRCASSTPNSATPGSGIVARTSPVFASKTVTECPVWLKA